jgi:photosystem II stability/assembly factor-like uncharacterized protein
VKDEEVATRRGLNPEILSALRQAFGLSDAEIAKLPQAKLETLLRRLRQPKVDRHAEALRYRRLRLQDEHGKIPPDAWVKAEQQKKQMPFNPAAWSRFRAPQMSTPRVNGPGKPGPSGPPKPMVAGIDSAGWEWLGPGNIGGRVRSLLIHPTNTSIMWAGSVGGGVWKTLNGGTSWFPLDDFMPNLAICCMVMDPNNPDVIYAATGEGFGNIDAIQGAGIFKTTDGGTNWTQLPSTAPTATNAFLWVTRLAISPANSQVMLAATANAGGSFSMGDATSGVNGIWLTTDGGSSWTQTFGGALLDVAFDANDASKCIASGKSGLVLYSTDGGKDWSAASGVPASGAGRVEVAYAPSNPTIVYASVDRNNGELYRSTDGGQTYSLRNTGHNYFSDGSDPEQGWYDNCLWVDPTNPNTLVIGGIDLWRSTDGGSTLNDITSGALGPGVHSDQHAIVSPANFNGSTVKTVFVGNDGGVFMTTDIYGASGFGGPWTELNNNLGITQFYAGAGNTSNGEIIGGAQDNGICHYVPNSGWSQYQYIGDGGFCAADSSGNFYSEYAFLDLYRNCLVGGAMVPLCGIADSGTDSTANFIAPFVLNPNNPNMMVAGGASLWRTFNVQTCWPICPNWTVIKPPVSSSSLISAIAIAPGNSDIIWVGYNDGEVYATTDGTDPTPTWTQKNVGTPGLPSRLCTRIAIDPNNENQVYATFGGFSSGNVWRTTDGGATWTDISGNLEVPVLSVVIEPHDSSYLYLGTEAGVFASDNGGASWSPSNDGPANVEVDELFWVGDSLYAATHGRGMFVIHPIIWVDFNYTGSFQNGTFDYPFATLVQGINAVRTGGNILIRTPGSSPERLTISKPMSIHAFAGPATIGR